MEIVRRLRGAGHTAYLAGGCVRDTLLGLTPTDFDVATNATPDQIGAMFRRSSAVGESFGVVLVREGHAVVEVATFRADGPYSDQRRPDHVVFAGEVEDSRRRDFTINALFLDPESGRVIDHVGGVDDLKARVLRAVGDPEQRLAEDHLRALRAVRFAARLGFEIEPETRRAVARDASALAGVSRERIGDEVRRMLAHPTRVRAAALVHELGLDAPVLGRAVGHRPLPVLGALAPEGVGLGLALGAWALDRSEVPHAAAVPGLVAAWRAGLLLSNDEREAMRRSLAGVFEVERDFHGLGVAASKRLMVAEGFGDVLALLRARSPSLATEVEARRVALERTRSGLSPPALISGDDLAALGLTPGPQFATLLASVYDAQLEDRVGTRAEALGLVRDLLAGPAEGQPGDGEPRATGGV